MNSGFRWAFISQTPVVLPVPRAGFRGQVWAGVGRSASVDGSKSGHKVLGPKPRVVRDHILVPPPYSAELAHSFNSVGSWWNHAEIGPESFGIVVCRSVGTVPGILRLVPAQNRRSPAGSLKVCGALVAQPKLALRPKRAPEVGLWDRKQHSAI